MAAAYSMGSAESRAEDSDARSSEPRPVLTGERLAPPNRASTLADDPQLLELLEAAVLLAGWTMSIAREPL
jgi:hypothetical protein